MQCNTSVVEFKLNQRLDKRPKTRKKKMNHRLLENHKLAYSRVKMH